MSSHSRNLTLALLPLLLACFMPPDARGQTACQHMSPGRTALVRGNQHAFILQTPPGWVPEIPPGIPAAFHRDTETWRDGRAVMYANTATVDSGNAKPPEEVIREDSSHFADETPFESSRCRR